MVDISGKKMGNAVFAQTLNVINKTPPANKIIPVAIDTYTKSEDGKQWLATHVDGLP
ncbi:ABC transporter periplasmic-binding protein yphF precursor [Raoultella ornithinolytica]|nr:ABC transporter periplasmic-binding protein yphF precursor [Raoultella ornithinolytica]